MIELILGVIAVLLIGIICTLPNRTNIFERDDLSTKPPSIRKV